MKRILVISILWLFCLPVLAADFVGKWQVTRVDYPEHYYGEIKYPQQFELLMRDGKLVGHYKDQFGYECEFPLSVVVNGGEELLLMVCGTTKSGGSWAPLNKVKIIDGEMVGVVVTGDRQFTWHARRAQDASPALNSSQSTAPGSEHSSMR